MSCPVMPPVEITRIGDAEMAHEFGQIALCRLQKQVKVIVHQYIAEELDAVDTDRLYEQLKKSPAVFVIPEDGSLFVAATSYMMYSAGVVDPEGSGHLDL
jgi:hypothetical protein